MTEIVRAEVLTLVLDASQVDREVSAQEKLVKAGLQVLEGYEISEKEKPQVEELLKLIKVRINKLEATRKAAIKSASDAVNKVNGRVRRVRNELTSVEYKLKNLLKDHEKRRREAEAARLAAIAEAAATGDEEKAEALLAESESVQSSAGISMSDVWKWEVVNKPQVPEHLKMLDSKAINEQVRDGVRDIPGLRIYQDTQISVRAR